MSNSKFVVNAPVTERSVHASSPALYSLPASRQHDSYRSTFEQGACNLQFTKKPRMEYQQPTVTNISTNFLSLPSELRNGIYEQLLVLQEPIDCLSHYGSGQSQIQALTPGLLRVNRTVHFETSSMLYARNRFDFTLCDAEDVTVFLEQIGHQNASYILSICIDFPKFHYLELHDVTFKDDSDRILTKIQNDCTNLSTIVTSLNSTNAMEERLDALDYPKIAVEALALVNTRFRAISSLQEIIVEAFEMGPSDHIRKEMKKHGWVIRETENFVELDFDIALSDMGDDDFGYFDDVDYDYWYDNDSGGDEYDIDDDSDYWRRAGD